MAATVDRNVRIACISVDLDEVYCYERIHGVSLEAEARHAVYDRALPRFARLFEAEGIAATFFVVGKDADRGANRLRELHSRGHELANHSLNHLYDVSRASREKMVIEVRGGVDAIEGATGVRPVGFRAPGYIMSDRLFDVLDEEGCRYDSSVFPCPAYWGAKAAVLGWMRLSGRNSESLLDDPRMLSAPADPYRVNRPYWLRGLGMLEMPIGVTRGTTGRLPFIGTSLSMAGVAGARQLAHAMIGRPLVNLELHGMDLCDANLDRLEALRSYQPDLQRSAEEKEAALVAAIEVLRDAGYRFTTLNDAANHFS